MYLKKISISFIIKVTLTGVFTVLYVVRLPTYIRSLITLLRAFSALILN